MREPRHSADVSRLTWSSSARAIHRAVDGLLHEVEQLLGAVDTKGADGRRLTRHDARVTPTPFTTTNTITATSTATTSMTPTTRTCSSVRRLSVPHSASPLRLSGHNDVRLSLDSGDAEVRRCAMTAHEEYGGDGGCE